MQRANLIVTEASENAPPSKRAAHHPGISLSITISKGISSSGGFPISSIRASQFLQSSHPAPMGASYTQTCPRPA